MTRFLSHWFNVFQVQMRRIMSRYALQFLLSFIVLGMIIQTQQPTESNLKSDQIPSSASALMTQANSSKTQSETQSNSSSELLFRDDFEAGIAEDWIYERPNDNAVQVVDAPGRLGNAVKFDLRRGDGERAEIRLAREPAGAERWYGFKTLLPENWESDRSFEMIAQWHGWPDFEQGESWRTPPLSLIVEGDRIKIHNRWDPKRVTENNDPTPEGGTETIWQGNYAKGEWSDWTFRVKWSHRSDGLIQVWRDGEKIVDRRGPNTYNDESGIYFKTGLYKPHWKNENSDTSTTTRRTLYVDDVRIGDRTMTRDRLQGLSEDSSSQSQTPALNRTASITETERQSEESSTLSQSETSSPASRISLDQLQSHGGSKQDQQVELSVSDDGYDVELSGNGWKNRGINYNVTPETILEFEFRSGSTGEIHAIGFDTNRRVTSSDAARTFKLSGTQDWGNSQFDDYVTGSGWKSYRISVGEYFTGEMDYLTLVNDHDIDSPTASSEFRNIRLFEQPSQTGNVRDRADIGLTSEWSLQSDTISAVAVDG
jgi:hypothetical protein